MIAIPKVLPLLVTETATALIPSKVAPAVLVVREISPAVLLTKGPVPVCIHGPRLVGPPAVVILHTAAVLCIHGLLDWGWRGYVVR